MKKIFVVLLGLSFLYLIFLLDGCFLIKRLAGADIDPVQFEKDREAKMLQVQAKSMKDLNNRLSLYTSFEDADLTFYLSQDFLNKIALQYDSTSGWLDKSTSYIIKCVNLKINNGSAIASLGLIAHHTPTDVNVDMTMDCIFAIELVNEDLVCKLEPFNISPNVTALGVLASADEIIGNLIKINLANLNNNFPPIKIPVNFKDRFDITENRIEVKDKINMGIMTPSRKVDYNIKMKEILFLEGKAFVAFNIEKVEVK